jgi:Fuc2NAc and GlcNAc transferase
MVHDIMTGDPGVISGLAALIAFFVEYKYPLICFSNLVIGGAGAWFISRSSYRVRLLDVPDGRSSHRVVTPKGGGIGILAAFVLTAMILRIPTAFVFSALLVSLVSLYGDSRDLSARFRLIIHFSAAFLLIFPSLYMAAIMSVQAHQLIPLPFLLAVPYLLFIVGTANFYNFMDGIDGIAGITGVVGFGLLYFYMSHDPLFTQQLPFSILALSLAFSCLGFLPFNLPRAKVFMGDVSSVLLGFVFAGMVVKFSQNLLDFICMTSFLFPFFADELTTILVRLGRREKLTQPHRRHFYQLLANERQIAHWKISLGYGIVQLFIGLSVLRAKPFGLLPVLLLLGLYFLIFVCLNIHIRKKMSS